MHNGLIFPYHRVRAHSNPRALRGWLLPNRPTERRIAKGGRRRVGHPRRWLSWGKCVGGPVGKSAGRNSETRCRAVTGEVTDPMLSRKASSEWTRCPYPKPTQVDR